MAKTRDQKEATVDSLAERLGRVEVAVFADYQGLTVRQTEELRGNLKEQELEFEVVKNTLFSLAAKRAGLEVERPTGPVAVAFGFSDPVAVAKALNSFAKDNEQLEITGGVFEGKIVEAAMIKQLAALPSREDLLGRLVGSISAPTRNLANVLGATSRNLVYALRAVGEGKTS
jgi:large subunit ribosomal protein L10